MRPEPGMTICDPACGTGGFLLGAHEYVSRTYPYLDPDEKRHLRFDALRGVDIVDTVARLCVMNLLLHGIGAEDADSPIAVDDSLEADPGERYDLVLTNPPFGKRSSMTVVNAEGETEREDLVIVRDDFWASTSNKQLNFLQHVKTLLKIGGRAAVVVPDNVLFEGGAGETVRRKLLHECDVHTLLRLPTGILLRAGGEGERPLLRAQARLRGRGHVDALGLRPADEHALHAQAEAAPLRAPRGLRPGLQPRRSPGADGERALPPVHVRGAPRAGQGQPRPHLAARRVARGLREPPAPDVLAQEIAEDLEAALSEFSAIAATLRSVSGDQAELTSDLTGGRACSYVQ
jgi:hypothetical protein